MYDIETDAGIALVVIKFRSFVQRKSRLLGYERLAYHLKCSESLLRIYADPQSQFKPQRKTLFMMVKCLNQENADKELSRRIERDKNDPDTSKDWGRIRDLTDHDF